MKYQKKPVIIEAEQWDVTEETWLRIKKLDTMKDSSLYPHIVRHTAVGTLTVDTLEGRMCCEKGNWIIKGVEGELYPCADSIFRKTYEAIDESI